MVDIPENRQVALEKPRKCDIANERSGGKGKSIWDFVRIIGLVTVLAYMVVILVGWIYRGDCFTAGESNQIMKYTEWFLGIVGIVSLFEIVFKQFATIPKRYFKHFGTFVVLLVFIMIGASIGDAAAGENLTNSYSSNNIVNNFYTTVTQLISGGVKNTDVNSCSNGCDLSNGTYIISSTIDLSGKHNIRISGSGKSTVIKCTGNIDAIGIVDSNNIEISDLVIEGCGQNGISNVNVSDSLIHDIEIYGADLKGIAFSGGHNNKVYNNDIHDNGQEGITIATDISRNIPTYDFFIYDNSFKNNGAYGGLGTVSQSSDVYITNINFYHNYVNSKLKGFNNVNLGGCLECSITDNILIAGSKQPITLGIVGTPQQKVNNSIISNNIIRNVPAGWDAIRIQAGYNNAVENNKIFSESGNTFTENAGDFNVVIDNVRLLSPLKLISINGGNSIEKTNYP